MRIDFCCRLPFLLSENDHYIPTTIFGLENRLHFYFNSLYFDVAMSAIPIIRTTVWLGWKVPQNVQAAEPRAKIKPA
jgi:hypothetical protein